MISFTLLAATTAVSLGVLTVLCVVAVRPVELQPGTVGPFEAPDLADPAADTMAGGRSEATLAGDWHEVTLNKLSDVENLLDSLEAQSVAHREMSIVGNDKFLVRWR
jgi:hypothetical protein